MGEGPCAGKPGGKEEAAQGAEGAGHIPVGNEEYKMKILVHTCVSMLYSSYKEK
jgi:hypothetical protein